MGLLKGRQFQIDPANSSLRLLGLAERELCAVTRRWSAEVKTAVDIGANDGWYTISFATQPNIQIVIACEPDPTNLTALQTNLLLNKNSINSKVSIIPNFIGSSLRWGEAPAEPASTLHGSLASLSRLEPPGSMPHPPCNSSLPPCSQLDDIVQNTSGPYLIKIDVEGAELDVLRSGTQTLNNEDCRLIVETHSEQFEQDCIEFLQHLGYVCRIIPNAWYRRFIPEHRSLPHNRWFSAKR